MAVIISVVSPHESNNGNTTLAMLIAMSIASARKSCCITHTNKRVQEFADYLGLQDIENEMSAVQIARLLQGEALNAEQFGSYCRQITTLESLDIFSNKREELTQDEMNLIIDFIVNHVQRDYIVLDVDLTGNQQEVQKALSIIKKSDIVILNTEQGVKSIKKLNVMESALRKTLKNIDILRVCNKYDDRVSSLTEFENKVCGIGSQKQKKFNKTFSKPTTLKVRNNYWVAMATNSGRLPVVFNSMRNGDARIIEVYKDIQDIANTIYKIALQKVKSNNVAHSKVGVTNVK